MENTNKMKTKTFTPIAMPCTKKQWRSLFPILVENDLPTRYFEHDGDAIITNDNYGDNDNRVIGFFNKQHYVPYNGEMQKTFDADLFLRCCGVEVEETKQICENCDGCHFCFGVPDCKMKSDCEIFELKQPEPWQPKYGDVVEVQDEGESWFIMTFVAINHKNGRYIVTDNIGDVMNFDNIRQPQPDYSTHIEAIKAEAAKFGKTVNVKIEEV